MRRTVKCNCCDYETDVYCPHCGHELHAVNFKIVCSNCSYVAHNHGACPYAISGYDPYHDCKRYDCPEYPKP